MLMVARLGTSSGPFVDDFIVARAGLLKHMVAMTAIVRAAVDDAGRAAIFEGGGVLALCTSVACGHLGDAEPTATVDDAIRWAVADALRALADLVRSPAA